MAAPDIEVRASGVDEAHRGVHVFIRNASDFSLTHANIAAWLDSWVMRNLRTEGGLLSDGPWRPFSAGGRVMDDGSVDTSAKLLQDTGRLSFGFDPIHDAKSAGIRNTVEYAGNHNLGIGTIKRRIFPDKPDEVEDGLMKLYERHLALAARRAGLRTS